MIRVVSILTLIAGVILLGPSRSLGQQGGSRGLPDAPSLDASNPSPRIGPSPGALDTGGSSDTSVIGGRARGGAGRIARKFSKNHQGMSIGEPSGGNALAMSRPFPGPTVDDPDAPKTGLALASIVEDDGVPDGLTLDDAIVRLLAANLDLIALRYEIPQADAEILTASLRGNPLVFTDAQLVPYGPYTSARPTGPTEYDISITQPIDISQKRRARVAVARAAKSTVEAQFQDAARRQIGNLTKTFVDLQAARLDALTAESSVKAQSSALDRARTRGAKAEEISRIEELVDKAGDALDDARDALDDARESLGLLLNLDPSEASTLQPRGGLRVDPPPIPGLDDLTRLALSCRPDVVAARRGIGRARREVDLARASRLDDVFLFYDPFSYQDNRLSKQPSGRSWALGLTVPLPIFNRNQGNIAKAGTNLIQTEVELSALERRVVSEIRLADREFRTSGLAFEKADRKKQPIDPREHDRLEASFAAGSITLGDYQDKLDSETDAAKAYRDALIRRRRAMLDLNTAVGSRILP